MLTTALLKSALSSYGFETETAPDAATARTLLDDFDPDVMIVDINLGEGPSGIDLTHYVCHQMPYVAVLVLTQYKALVIDRAPE